MLLVPLFDFNFLLFFSFFYLSEHGHLECLLLASAPAGSHRPIPGFFTQRQHRRGHPHAERVVHAAGQSPLCACVHHRQRRHWSVRVDILRMLFPGRLRTPHDIMLLFSISLTTIIVLDIHFDLGAESISEIPTDKWTLVVLVFTNHTHTASPADDVTASDALPLGVHVTSPDDEFSTAVDSKQASLLGRAATEEQKGKASSESPQYSIVMYFNGKLDAKMDFSDVVIANNHSAHFFNDVSFGGKSAFGFPFLSFIGNAFSCTSFFLFFLGPKALLTDFTIWDSELSSDEINAMYLSNAAQAHHAPADLALSVLQQARSPLVHPFASTASAPAGGTSSRLLPNPSDTTGDLAHPHIPDDSIVPILLERARVSLESCESYETRVDLYAEAAERGSAEALYKWALLVKQGAAVANTACGVDSSGEGSGAEEGSASTGSVTSSLWSSLSGKKTSTASAFEQDRATMAMLIAADQGHAPALVSLAFTLLNGVGAEPLLRSQLTYSTEWNIPVHPAFTAFDPSSGHRVYRQSLLRAAIGRYLNDDASVCSGAATRSANVSFDLSAPRGNDIFGSVLFANTSRTSVEDHQNKKYAIKCPSPTDLALGMLQLAAVHRVAEAQQALAHR